MHIRSLNLLKLAPGGHLGRFTIWTESAFRLLDDLYGSYTSKSKLKTDYNLPQHKMTVTDLKRLFQSDELQAALRPRKAKPSRRVVKKNPLRHIKVMLKLNPYAEVIKRKAHLQSAKIGKKSADVNQAAKASKADKGGKPVSSQQKSKKAGAVQPAVVQAK